jgi:SAM-dependent methyltransferase
MQMEWVGGTAGAWPCPACGAKVASPMLLLRQAQTSRTYVRCHNCKSVFPAVPDEDDTLGGYAPGRAEHDMGLKHYVEIGAGFASLLRPVLELVPQPQGRLLDVGCGFGFVVDAWARMGGQASGIELASYGYWGRELLGADISHQLLADNTQLRGQQFDLVYSSEVIEHVRDPAAFIADLKAMLAPDGVLVLTTPTEAVLRPDAPVPVVLAALSPGAHRFVASAGVLEGWLRAAGFAWVRVTQETEQVVAWAAASPRELLADANARAHAMAVGYQDLLAASPHPWLRGGAGYRSFREHVNAGRYTLAAVLQPVLEAQLMAELGPEARWTEAIAGWPQTGGDGVPLVAAAPCWTGPFLYYRGMLTLNTTGDHLRAARDFQLSFSANRHWARHAPQLAQEPSRLLAAAWFHLQLAMRHAGAGLADLWAEVANADPEGWTVFSQRPLP